VLLRAGRSTYEPSRAGGWWLSSPLRRFTNTPVPLAYF
jgi:hypothetical protein